MLLLLFNGRIRLTFSGAIFEFSGVDQEEGHHSSLANLLTVLASFLGTF